MPFDAEIKHNSETGLLEARHKLYCASCGHWISSNDWQLSIKDAHEHTVFNPAGIVFHIGCFRDAPGCWATGQPSSDFTWFKGYEWRLALCEGCGKHLGWLFTGVGPVPAFFGLILKQISDQPSDI